MKFDWIRVLRDVLMVVVLATLATAGFGYLMVGLPVWTLYAVMLALLTGWAILLAIKRPAPPPAPPTD